MDFIEPEPAVEFSDFAIFSYGAADMRLVDIINAIQVTDADTAYNSPDHRPDQNNFRDSPGAWVYELDIGVDTRVVADLGVTSIRVELFGTNNMDVDPFFDAVMDLGIGLPPVDFLLRTSSPYWDSASETIDSFGSPSDNLPSLPSTHTVLLSPTWEQSSSDWARTLISSAGLGAFRPVRSRPAVPSLDGSELSPGDLVMYQSQAGVLLKDSLMGLKDPINMLARSAGRYPTLAAKFGLGSSSGSDPYELLPPKTIAQATMHQRRSLVEVRRGLQDLLASSTVDEFRLAQAVIPPIEDGFAQPNDELSPDQDDSRNLGYSAKLSSHFKRVRRRFEIKKTLITGNFWVRLTPQLRGRRTDISSWTRPRGVDIIFSVGHATQREELLRPRNPPLLSLVSVTKGRITLRIQQTDPEGLTNAKTKIVRSYVSETSPGVSQTEVVSTLDHNEARGEIFTDALVQNIFPNNVIYRAITVDWNGGNNAGPSSGLVVPGVPLVGIDVSDSSAEVVVIAENMPEAIMIDVLHLPANARAIKLFRENTSGKGTYVERTTVIPAGDREVFVISGAPYASFSDTNALQGSAYRYFVAVIPDIGPEYVCAAESTVVRRVPSSRSTQTADMSQPQISDAGSEISVQMALSAAVGIAGFNFVLDLLRRSGASDAFIQAVTDGSQRDAFDDLLAFLVERVDETTGETASFGIQAPGTFADDHSTRDANGRIPPPKAGRNYRYYAKLCSMPPAAFFQDMNQLIMTYEDPGRPSTAALTRAFLSAYSERSPFSPGGALPSVQELVTPLPPELELARRQTGLVVQRTVQIPSISGGIHNGHIFPTGVGPGNQIKISWNVRPEGISNIDSFLVFVQLGDLPYVCLGAVACDGSTTHYYFVDARYGAEPGPVRYHVRMVYNDLSLGEFRHLGSRYNSSYTPVEFLKVGAFGASTADADADAEEGGPQG